MIRILGATTTYRLEENGTISIRQGDNATESLCWEDGRTVRGATQIGTYADGGVYFFRFRDFYEIGRDDVPRVISAEAHARRSRP